ncbi:Integrase core domain and FYVE/PHD zinc finger containing protein [Klebsormidium nitens]|uniref:Integrase core domain and FYVE/PHD zinc finger containing protein n=1 Tax=Klebsormidium nitens TaxID=105231 RepID=A0A1Y1IPX1_KLENI|nr:Integrase core domain and FYVE/PHD zinc finger containing protein [Klebsormidium nitens]|eukprot:GAQ92744.1 Integrase core domain and FYVE/PHD zinc finger containing protein [Klebsormidium nitens]
MRASLIRRVHQDVGHYGVLKTYLLLSPTYWWVGMYGQVQHEVAGYTVCDRVKATFDVKDPELKPLPIMGMFYRWGADLCKMPQKSDDGNRYVVVMVEHFTKWIELRAIPAKEAKHVAAAFRDTDGLAERIVQVVKEAVRKYGLLFNKRHWDRFLQWIAMGYRMSRQASLGGYSPYYLLFGRHPIVGSKVRDILQEPVDLDDSILCAEFLHDRAELVKEIGLMAFVESRHRSAPGHPALRARDFKPKLRRYEVGDLVYLRRQPADSLDPKVGRLILRVKELKGTGRVLLEGRDQKTITEHVENCAPCHNPSIDLWQNPVFTEADRDQACQVCHKTTGAPKMLLCDNCDEGWHMHCLTPPVKRMPKGNCFCPRCPVNDDDN